ncbi:MAG: hypothetical protein M3P91_06445 [Actinomycetota bacterium]|nr:hypothetical protein [Actinomycetota bacterium]
MQRDPAAAGAIFIVAGLILVAMELTIGQDTGRDRIPMAVLMLGLGWHSRYAAVRKIRSR